MEAAVKRIGPLHLLALLGVVALSAPGAQAASRCSDEPEPCVKRTATLSRPVTRVIANEPAARVQPTLLAAPAPAPTAKKVAAPARKPAAKPQRTTPTPTPGMGMLLKLSTGSGDISWLPAQGSEAQRQSWVL